jgi:hypothetical protein
LTSGLNRADAFYAAGNQMLAGDCAPYAAI